jgi:hypothetical protein
MTERVFKNKNGVWLTREIFFETSTNRDNVLYTLKQEPHNEYPSLYQRYISYDDPTEYTFAVTELGGWSHWKALQQAAFFAPYLTEWREEVEVRARAAALAKIILTADGNSKDAFAAQKFIANKEWDKKTTSRGRPSNAEVKRAANDIASTNKQLSDDLARMLQ